MSSAGRGSGSIAAAFDLPEALQARPPAPKCRLPTRACTSCNERAVAQETGARDCQIPALIMLDIRRRAALVRVLRPVPAMLRLRELWARQRRRARWVLRWVLPVSWLVEDVAGAAKSCAFIGTAMLSQRSSALGATASLAV